MPDANDSRYTPPYVSGYTPTFNDRFNIMVAATELHAVGAEPCQACIDAAKLQWKQTNHHAARPEDA